jgi:hypothetical protein
LFCFLTSSDWGERFFHWFFTTFILWSTIKIYLGLWITYSFFNFIGKSIHMFHHIFILMPPTIQCWLKMTFMTIITWNSICNIIIFLLFVNCVKVLFTSNWNPPKSKDEN